MVTVEINRDLVRSLRNVPLVDVCVVDDLNARQVLLRRYFVMTPEALELVEKKFAGADSQPKSPSKSKES